MRRRWIAGAGGIGLLAGAIGLWYAARARRARHPPSSTLDRFLPDPELRDVLSTEVHAAPEHILGAVAEVTAGELAPTPAGARRAPEPAGDGHSADGEVGAPTSAASVPILATLLADGRLVTLADDGREFAVGAVGRIGLPAGLALVPLAGPESFVERDAPGDVLIAASARVAYPSPSGGCWLIVEHRASRARPDAGAALAAYRALYWTVGVLTGSRLLAAARRRAEALSAAEAAARQEAASA